MTEALMETPQETALTCPECAEKGIERVFGTNQALAVHRYRSHGVRGTSRPSSKAKADEPKAETPKADEPKAETTIVRPHLRKKRGADSEEVAPKPKRKRTRGARGRRNVKATPVAEVMAFPTDKILKTVFPHGIVASSEMLGDVQTWLSEGEKVFAKAAVKNGNGTK